MTQVTQRDLELAEQQVARAEREVAEHGKSVTARFTSGFHTAKSFAKSARDELEALKAQQISEAAISSASREVAEIEAEPYIKQSVTDLEVAEQSLRSAAIKAQDSLCELLAMRQEFEDTVTRISAGIEVRGLHLSDEYGSDYLTGGGRGAVRIKGRYWLRTKDAETLLAWVTTRVAEAKVRNHGGLLAGYLSRYVGIRTLLTDVPLPSPAKFPAIERPAKPVREGMSLAEIQAHKANKPVLLNPNKGRNHYEGDFNWNGPKR